MVAFRLNRDARILGATSVVFMIISIAVAVTLLFPVGPTAEQNYILRVSNKPLSPALASFVRGQFPASAINNFRIAGLSAPDGAWDFHYLQEEHSPLGSLQYGEQVLNATAKAYLAIGRNLTSSGDGNAGAARPPSLDDASSGGSLPPLAGLRPYYGIDTRGIPGGAQAELSAQADELAKDISDRIRTFWEDYEAVTVAPAFVGLALGIAIGGLAILAVIGVSILPQRTSKPWFRAAWAIVLVASLGFVFQAVFVTVMIKKRVGKADPFAGVVDGAGYDVTSSGSFMVRTWVPMVLSFLAVFMMEAVILVKKKAIKQAALDDDFDDTLPLRKYEANF